MVRVMRVMRVMVRVMRVMVRVMVKVMGVMVRVSHISLDGNVRTVIYWYIDTWYDVYTNAPRVVPGTCCCHTQGYACLHYTRRTVLRRCITAVYAAGLHDLNMFATKTSTSDQCLACRAKFYSMCYWHTHKVKVVHVYRCDLNRFTTKTTASNQCSARPSAR